MWEDKTRGPESPEEDEGVGHPSGERAEIDHCASVPLAVFASMIIQDGIPSRGFPPGGAENDFRQKWTDNMQANNYWSGTEFAPNTTNAWNFNFNSGNQNNNNKDNNNYAWAVRPGE